MRRRRRIRPPLKTQQFLIGLLIMFIIFFFLWIIITGRRTPISSLDLKYTPEEAIKLCGLYCKALDYRYENETELHHLKYSDWCGQTFKFYLKCETYERCYTQRIGLECNESLNQFSKKYPELVKVNCSFHLLWGELCNPDEVEYGWIKCCENPSLENCNCKKVQ